MKKKATWLAIFALPVLAIGTYLSFNQSKPKVALDECLALHGFQLNHGTGNEGYVPAPQAKQFQEQLKVHPCIASIAKIGLNAGHSADIFLRSCKGVKKFTSFDIKQHAYTGRAVEYFKQYYKNCFEFVEGDSHQTVVEYAKKHPGQTFDLIYVDGLHTFEGCLNNLINCKSLAHPETTVWVDDYNISTIQSAINTLIGQGLIEIDSAHTSMSDQGVRQWAKLHYRFP